MGGVIGTTKSNIDHGSFTGSVLEKISYADKVHAVCWLDHKMLFINGSDLLEKLDDYKEHIIRLRVFDENEELHVWRTGKGLKYRIRSDEQGENEQEYIDSELIMNGTTAKEKGAFYEITEDRGVKYQMPKHWLGDSFQLKKNQRIKILTRNYIGYNELGQAGYVDCRFVEIKI